MTLEPGAPVELSHKADSGFVFAAYTGDCAPAGRMLMTQARNCGATFNPELAVPQGRTWTLTVTKPKGGTLIAAGGISCGTMGDNCSAEFDDGRQVVVEARPDPGFERSVFLHDCAQPMLVMTAPRSCGATFVEKGRGGTGSARPRPRSLRRPRLLRARNTGRAAAGDSAREQPKPGGRWWRGASSLWSRQTSTQRPSGYPMLLNKYCPAQESRDPRQVQAIYPKADMPGLKRAFSGYRSVKCEIGEPGKWKFIQLDGTKGTAHVQVGSQADVYNPPLAGFPRSMRPSRTSSWRGRLNEPTGRS